MPIISLKQDSEAEAICDEIGAELRLSDEQVAAFPTLSQLVQFTGSGAFTHIMISGLASAITNRQKTGVFPLGNDQVTDISNDRRLPRAYDETNLEPRYNLMRFWTALGEYRMERNSAPANEERMKNAEEAMMMGYTKFCLALAHNRNTMVDPEDTTAFIIRRAFPVPPDSPSAGPHTPQAKPPALLVGVKTLH